MKVSHYNCTFLYNLLGLKVQIRFQSNENDISLFPKNWCFKKIIYNFLSGEVGTLVVCDVTNYTNT